MSRVSRVRRVALLLVLSFGPLLGAASVRADDDWSVTREPKKRARARSAISREPHRPGDEGGALDLSERYYRALLARPEDAFALERLRELTLAKDGSLDVLVKRLEAERTARPDESRVSEALARVYLAAGTPDRALAELERALQGRPDHARAFGLASLRAEVLRGAGRSSEARAEYERLLAGKLAREELVEILRSLGVLALEAGDLGAAERAFARLAADNPRAVSARAEWPRALARAGRHAESARAFAALAHELSGDARAAAPLLREAAQQQLEAGDVAGALHTVDSAFERASPAERRELYDVMADAYRRGRRLPELAQRFAEESRTHPELVLRAAVLWDEIGDEQRAIAGYRAALRRAPRDVDARARLARLLVRGGRLDEVIREYEVLVSLSSDEPTFAVALSELLKNAGRKEEALRVLERASRRAPRSLSMHRALSELYARWGQKAEAEHELSLLAKLDPEDASHVIALGDEAFERGDKAEAERIWQRLLERGDDRAQAQATLGSVLGDHSLFDGAIAHMNRAIELAPERLDHRRSLASLLERAGKTTEAEAAWRFVLEHAGSDAVVRREARQHIVGLWIRGGLAPRRAAELEARFRARPADLEAGRTLSELYARDPGKAGLEIALLEQITSKDPRDLESLRALERAYTRRGALERALTVLDRLIEAEPGAAAVYLARAVELSLAMYRDDAARRYAERAVQIRPNDGKAQRLLGDLFRKKQDMERAVIAYERAAALDVRDHDTRLLLAQLETARGKPARAVRWLMDVVESSLDDELVARAARTAMQLDAGPEEREAFEAKLLELALSRPERVPFRRLLIESYAQSLAPLAARVRLGKASADEEERVARAGRSSLKPLLEALADSDPVQRATALDLLGAAKNPHAGAPLMALAEQGDVAAERAKALGALGLISAPALGPRLRALIAQSERRLLPLALWALLRSEGERAADVLLARLRDDRDASVRTMAALGLGALRAREAEASLAALARERHANVRAAALWSLSRIAPGAHRETLEEAAAGPSPASLVAIATLPDDPSVIARGLVSEDAVLSELSALRATSELDRAELPSPAWPFSARDYLVALLTSSLRPDPEALPRRWDALVASFERMLRGAPPERDGVLRALAPYAGGLAPLALLTQGTCPDPALARALAARLEPALGELASGRATSAAQGGFAFERALALLTASGALEHPSVLRALESAEDAPARRVVLDGLASVPELPAGVVKRLLRAYRSSADWPTRMRIVRALKDNVGKDELSKERILLVRAAAQSPAEPSGAPVRCAARPFH